MEIQFATTNTRLVTDLKPVTEKEFIHILEKYKPREIYNSHWSNNAVFIVITEYVEGGVMVYCNAWADKTPQIKTYLGLFDYLKYQGLERCFFTVEQQSNG